MKRQLTTDEQEILEALKAAMLRLDEASGIAKTIWPEKDPRVFKIESAWAEVYTVAKEYDPLV